MCKYLILNFEGGKKRRFLGVGLYFSMFSIPSVVVVTVVVVVVVLVVVIQMVSFMWVVLVMFL